MTTVPAEKIIPGVIGLDTKIIPYEEPTDSGEHKAHIVSPPENVHLFEPGMDAQDVVNLARDLGLEVVALCGYRWVPKLNPDDYDACQPCFVIAENIMKGLGE